MAPWCTVTANSAAGISVRRTRPETVALSATGMNAMSWPCSSSKNSLGYSAPSDPVRTCAGH